MICWRCHSNSVSTGSRLSICSDVKTRKRRNVVGIDMIRNNRICRWWMNTLVTSQYQPRLSRITNLFFRWIRQSDCSIHIRLNYSLISLNDQTRHEFSWLYFSNNLNAIYSHLWEHFANGDVLHHQHFNAGVFFLWESKLCWRMLEQNVMVTNQCI
jgi:hypothetical protein